MIHISSTTLPESVEVGISSTSTGKDKFAATCIRTLFPDEFRVVIPLWPDTHSIPGWESLKLSGFLLGTTLDLVQQTQPGPL